MGWQVYWDYSVLSVLQSTNSVWQKAYTFLVFPSYMEKIPPSSLSFIYYVGDSVQIWCAICWFLIFFFPCLATQKSKEQLPYSWSMKVPVPICMGNIQLHLTSAFLNSVIYWCSSYRSLSCWFLMLYTRKCLLWYILA